MLRQCFVIWMVSIGMMILGAGVVSGQATSTGSGQAYPNKSVRIVTGGVGGDSDFMARLVAQGLGSSLGQQVIVDNRPSGIIIGETVSKAPPDGYTLLVSGGTLWIGSLFQKTPYDPVKDFSPITLLGSSPDILVVHPSLPVKSVNELIALAKAKPGELNYGSGSTGSSIHLTVELLKHMAGVNIVRIYFKSGSLRMSSLLSGEVQLMFGGGSAVMPHVKSGRLRALAVASAQPSALAPGLPPVASSVPGYELVGVNGLWAPARTPGAIIRRLNQEVVRVLNTPDVKDKFFYAGVEAVGNSPEQFADYIRTDVIKMSKLIREADIRAE